MTKFQRWFAWYPVKINGKYKWLIYVNRYKKIKLTGFIDYSTIYDIGY